MPRRCTISASSSTGSATTRQPQILIGRSLASRPDHADALSDLSAVLRELGRLDEAIAAAERAIAHSPGHARAHTNLGNLLRQKGRLADAARAHATAVRLDPQIAAGHANLAETLLAQGRAEEALAACERALALAPQIAEAEGIRAQALHRLGRTAEALTAYRRALALKPGLAMLHTEIGNVLRQDGRFEEAIAAHRHTIAAQAGLRRGLGPSRRHPAVGGALGRGARRLSTGASRSRPHYAEGYSNLGVLLQLMGKSAEAIAAYRTATTLNPRYGLAHFNLGATLKDLERLEEAIGAFRQALACEPDLAPARFQLCNVRRHACDWRGLDREDADCLAGLRRDGVRVSPFPILAMSADPAVHLEHTRLWARGLIVASADILPARRIDVAQGRRIRLGYLSSDFQRHATASLIAELLERHDRRRFEVFGYCFSPDDGSDVRRRLLAAFDRLSTCAGSRMRKPRGASTTDGIDILVDLKGYTKDARTEILAHRPAPVQVNFLGYPGSMGADFIDYILADAFVAPMHLQPSFTERIVHLPDSYQPNDRRRQISPAGAVARRSAACRRRLRVLLVQQRLQDHARRCSRSGCACSPPCREACCGCWTPTPSPRPTCGARRRRGASIPAGWCSRPSCACRSTWRGSGSPTCSSIPCRSTRIPPPATPCGPGCRC